MKFFTRLGIYKNSTGTNQFNPETKEAYSYSWWKFCTVYQGKLLFNRTTYSNSTSKHQSDVLRLLDYNVDVMLYNTTESLDDPDSALRSEIKALFRENQRLVERINAPRTQKKKNFERIQTINSNGRRIVELSQMFDIDLATIEIENQILGYTKLDEIMTKVS